MDDLVTIRKGELVLAPLADKPVAAQEEWIKIRGRGRDWCCRFLDTESNACTIYNSRPISCRALKCWDTEDILALAGRNLLNRFDLIEKHDSLLSYVKLQEMSCPVPDMASLASLLQKDAERKKTLEHLTELVQTDLQIRTQAVQERTLSVALEMFYFGRPLFQLLQPFGILTTETPQGIVLKFNHH